MFYLLISPAEIYDHTGTVAATFCDIRGGLTGEGNINADPVFAASDMGDCHVQKDSPCINAGDPDYVAEPDETNNDTTDFYTVSDAPQDEGQPDLVVIGLTHSPENPIGFASAMRRPF